MTPSWPMGVPLWRFPTETDRITVDGAVVALIARVDAAGFVLRTSIFLGELGDVNAISASEGDQVRDEVFWKGWARSAAERA